MRTVSVIIFGTFIVLMTFGTALGQDRTPTFADLPAPQTFSGKAAPPQVTEGKAHTYRTRLREGAANGPNFADHYTVVIWGCGTDCVEFAIIDAKSGAVFFPAFLPVESVFERDAEGKTTITPRKVEFRRDSRLLVVTGTIRGGGLNHRHFFEWTGKGLKLVQASVGWPTY
jgi:hypothetical protein